MKAALVPVAKVNGGTHLVTDGGFTCMGDHATRIVRATGKGELYVACSHGHHFLDGQKDESGDFYVGFWFKGQEPPRRGITKRKVGWRAP